MYLEKHQRGAEPWAICKAGVGDQPGQGLFLCPLEGDKVDTSPGFISCLPTLFLSIYLLQQGLCLFANQNRRRHCPRVFTARCGKTREACIPRGLVVQGERQEMYLDRHLVKSISGALACPHQPCVPHAGELSAIPHIAYTTNTKTGGSLKS